jgi:putative acetyltransferase
MSFVLRCDADRALILPDALFPRRRTTYPSILEWPSASSHAAYLFTPTFVRETISLNKMLRIEQAFSEDKIAKARELFPEYAKALSVDLCFQDFARELQELPGKYAPPAGRLLLAYYNDTDASEHLAGCGALRPLSTEVCEMKRLYVRPEFRGRGIGRALTLALISAAHEIGYRALRLDTLPEMREAHKLYEELGFRAIAPYYENPVEGVRYLELDLSVSLLTAGPGTQ